MDHQIRTVLDLWAVPGPVLELTFIFWRFRVRFCNIFAYRSGSRVPEIPEPNTGLKWMLVWISYACVSDRGISLSHMGACRYHSYACFWYGCLFVSHLCLCVWQGRNSVPNMDACLYHSYVCVWHGSLFISQLCLSVWQGHKPIRHGCLAVSQLCPCMTWCLFVSWLCMYVCLTGMLVCITLLNTVLI